MQIGGSRLCGRGTRSKSYPASLDGSTHFLNDCRPDCIHGCGRNVAAPLAHIDLVVDNHGLSNIFVSVSGVAMPSGNGA